MTTLPIATRPDELTPGWLTEALRVGGHLDDATSVEAVEHRPLGTGQMCDSVRLTLHYSGATEAPGSMVAKLPAADDTSRATAVTMRSYEREVSFYRDLAPTLPMATPRVFHVDLDEADLGRFMLLLEDLAPAQQGDQLAGCSPAVASAAVQELVGLHAPRWDDAGLAELEWLQGDPEATRQMATMVLPMLWSGFTERYDDLLDPTAREVGRLLFDNLEAYLTPSGGPETIVHGDYRLDNLLIGPDGSIAGVVDWQTCTVGPGLTDVAYFIGAGLLEADRRSSEEGLVRTYHEALLAAGVHGYPWDECWRDYRRGTFAGVLMAVGASMMVERTERGDEMFLAMASRHSRHVLDLDAGELLTG